MIDRTELRKQYALTLTATGDAYWDAAFKCVRAVPGLLDRITDLERGIRCSVIALRKHWPESPTAVSLDELLDGRGPHVADHE